MQPWNDGTFEKASEHILKSRRKVYRVRRQEPLGIQAEESAPNPFAAVTLGTKAGNEPGTAQLEENKDMGQGTVVQEDRQTSQNPSGFGNVFGSKAGGFGSLAATATRGTGANGLAFGKPSTEYTSTTEQKAVFGTLGKSQNALDREANEVETGEEGEENVFSCNATLFLFESKQWKERGKGLLKINLGKDKKQARVIMRQQGNLKLLLNANLWEKMKVSKMEGATVRCICAHLCYNFLFKGLPLNCSISSGNYFCVLQSFI